ncbi:MAG: caspase family protein, partial [Verrucomicrobiota bacterium]
FAPKDIIELKDAAATSTKLTQTIKEHFIRNTTAGDTVLLYFAGHGTGVKDFDSDEKDGVDEVLMTYDFDPKVADTWFTDDLLFELLQRVPTQRVITIYDCCHSGSGNRSTLASALKESADGTRSRGSISGFYSFDLDIDSAEYSNSRSLGTGSPNPNHLFFAACHDDQKALEGLFSGQRHGLFTQTLIETLRDHHSAPLSEVNQQVANRIAAVNKLQRPTFRSGHHCARLSIEGYLAATLSAPSESQLDETAEGVPRLRPPTLDDVAPDYCPAGDIGVLLTLRNLSDDGKKSATFTPGDYLEIDVRSDTPGYLELYYYGVDDNIYCIFPNDYHSDNRISTRPLTVPGEMGFGLKMALPKDFAAPVANEILVAIVTTEPFDELTSAKTKQSIFQKFDGKKLNPRAQRLIEVVEKKTRFGEAIQIYQITQ